jgi:hypothetical protein
LAASAIRHICRLRSIPFKDTLIDFDDKSGVVSGILKVQSGLSIGHTSFNIINAYVENATDLTGQEFFTSEDQKQVFLIHQATLLRRVMFACQGHNWNIREESAFVQRLYQRPFVWLLMKDIICPVVGCQIKNLLLVAGASSQIDVARGFKSGEVHDRNLPEEDFIFVNDEVKNEAVKSALLFVEVLKFHELSPVEVVRTLFEGKIYEKMLVAAKLAFVHDQAVDEFVAVLFEVLDLDPDLYPHLFEPSGIKSAQSWDRPYHAPMQWWYSGLTEKMLGQVRGEDWTTYQSLEGLNHEFWEQVEKIKNRKPQGEGVNFNDLLRLKQVQTSDPQEMTKTIQGLLSSQRVWQ